MFIFISKFVNIFTLLSEFMTWTLLLNYGATDK